MHGYYLILQYIFNNTSDNKTVTKLMMRIIFENIMSNQ